MNRNSLIQDNEADFDLVYQIIYRSHYSVTRLSAKRFAKPIFRMLLHFSYNWEEAINLIAQICIESSYFTTIRENLYYTTAERLRRVFPSYFKSKYNPNDYLRNPVKLGNLVYGNRYGNSSTNGYIFRGGGLIQTTFKDMYLLIRTTVEKITGQTYDIVDFANLVQTNDEYATMATFAYVENKTNLRRELKKSNNMKNINKIIAGSDFGLSKKQASLDKINKYLNTI